MTRLRALELAAQIIRNMRTVNKRREHREYQSDLNYLATCLLAANAGETDPRSYEK